MGSGVRDTARDDWRLTGDSANHHHRRTLEPILLDFELPSTAQTSQPPQRKQSSRLKRRSAVRLANLQPSVNMSDERRPAYKQVLEDRIASALTQEPGGVGRHERHL